MSINRSSLLLLRMNLQWHAHVTKALLMRYKITILFLILALSPTIAVVQSFIVLPTQHLVMSHPTRFAFGGSLIGFQCLALIWFFVQQALFCNHSFEKYLLSLPIRKAHLIMTDLGMLLVVNTALWLSLFYAAFLQPWDDWLLLLSRLSVIISLTLLCQLACKKARPFLLISVFLLDIIWIVFGFNLPIWQQLFLFGAIQLSGLYCIFLCFNPVIHSSQSNCIRNHTKIKTIGVFKFPPIIKIQLQYMLKTHPANFIFLSLNLSFLLISLYFLANINLTPYLILLAALFISHFFQKFHYQRLAYHDFLAALPLSKLKLFSYDYFLTGGTLLIFSLIAILLSGTIHPLSSIFTLFNAQLYLLTCYYPQIKYKKYGAFISGGLMLLFIGLNQLSTWI